MPKKARELTALDVKRLQHPNPASGQKHRFPVGGVNGLYLVAAPSGARSWLWRYSFCNRRKAMGIGPYPDVTLAMARDRAREMADKVWRGIDPSAERSKRRMTFANAMEEFLKVKLAEFENIKHRKQWRVTLDTYALPVLGVMPVDKISVADVLRVLNPIWEEKTETASRLRGRIEMVLAWATVNGHREGDNPARWRGNLDATLAKPGKIAKVIHQPALAIDEAVEWYADVRNRDGIATRALEFLALTAARSGEVRGATWSEIDLDRCKWTVPAQRMKARREHIVPLTEGAVKLLVDAPRVLDSEYVFPAARGGALSDAAMSACMRRINEARAGGYLDRQSGRPATVHGLRSTFRDWAADRGVDHTLAELVLAHAVGSETERAYRRSDMIDRRRNLMADWACFLQGETYWEDVNSEAKQ
ncbi:integrase arm-type DNA-binding domain-containing protein [Alisedimentitalea sp. MJ-SS2]|uniref:tyrosine-type recombinase/integrase n=1 Tax=Aliisedimentitalea sp. MJ-SS2 TaxID=3049795 RepID=UPI0029136052|nr:integrase arm-type DNA-binding domain-containing protein [Alisedimentitalea sp. MJ-SS2]MDU8929680.1 integrase arm-type DNA-binding domain-containing protein [Alisedimentitalea sp. MJ-SS2]